MAEVHTQWFKTVFFLCVEQQGLGFGVFPKATGFFVRVPIEGTTLSADYLVTARHCIEEARAEGHRKLIARFNRKDAPFIEVPTALDDWICHDRADVAAILVLPETVPADRNTLDAASIELNQHTFTGPGPLYEYTGHVPDVGIRTFQPGVGHEVYFLGLFTESFGQERNLPVARFGNIARMPETLSIESGKIRQQVVGYLVELHSIGGHSGSPVFFEWPMLVTINKHDAKGKVVFDHVELRYHNALLGLITAHYDVKNGPVAVDELGEIQVKLNSGMAIVTPAEGIRELLVGNEELIEQRRRLPSKE